MSAIRRIKVRATFGGKLLFLGALANGTASATDFTARKVMQEMDGVERYAFVAGVVEGLAVARYNKDGKLKQGMDCIYDWFYQDKTTKETIYAALTRFGDYPPAAVVHTLVKRKCGE